VRSQRQELAQLFASAVVTAGMTGKARAVTATAARRFWRKRLAETRCSYSPVADPASIAPDGATDARLS
jgi:uncharacterized MAPEG superfamily protein